MDISYVSGQEKFNDRVCALMLSRDKILAMHDERSPYSSKQTFSTSRIN